MLVSSSAARESNVIVTQNSNSFFIYIYSYLSYWFYLLYQYFCLQKKMDTVVYSGLIARLRKFMGFMIYGQISQHSIRLSLILCYDVESGKKNALIWCSSANNHIIVIYYPWCIKVSGWNWWEIYIHVIHKFRCINKVRQSVCFHFKFFYSPSVPPNCFFIAPMWLFCSYFN